VRTAANLRDLQKKCEIQVSQGGAKIKRDVSLNVIDLTNVESFDEAIYANQGWKVHLFANRTIAGLSDGSAQCSRSVTGAPFEDFQHDSSTNSRNGTTWSNPRQAEPIRELGSHSSGVMT